MNQYFAVFNVRKGEITKARKAFVEKFGEDAWKTHIRPILRDGIMSVFRKPPTDFTQFFVDTVADVVNARVEKTSRTGGNNANSRT